MFPTVPAFNVMSESLLQEKEQLEKRVADLEFNRCYRYG